MKKFILFVAAVMLISVSCKKDKATVTQFTLQLTNPADSVYYHSVSYAVFSYSDARDIKDSADLYNPEFFTSTAKVVKPYTLSLTSEHTYVLKKLELFDSEGKLLFYIPQRSQQNNQNTFALPFSFKPVSGTILLSVVRQE